MTTRITQTKGKNVDKKIFAASAGLANAVTVALQETVKFAKVAEDAAISQMSGGDMKLSHARGKMKARGGLRNQRYAAGEAAVGPSGPVALINNGSPPHVIGVGKRTTAKRARNLVKFSGVYGSFSRFKVEKNSGVKRLYLSDRNVWTTAPVLHPGMKGKGQWSRVRDDVIRPTASRNMRFVLTKGAMAPFGPG